MEKQTSRMCMIANPPLINEGRNAYLRRISSICGNNYFSVEKSYRTAVKKGLIDKITINISNSLLAKSPQTPSVETHKKLPKILIIDIETSPIKCFTWGLFKQNISTPQIITDRFIICWSAKWLYDKDVISDCCTPKEAVNSDDKRIILSCHEILSQADIVIAHNGKKFDLPIINTRILKWGLQPVHPFQTIDTCLIARKQFGNVSNKLNYINGMLDLDQKIDTGGFELWIRCLDGEKDALLEMEEYNRHDVLILEELYVAMRPFIKSHPNLGLFNHEESVCPNCGSNDIKDDGAFYFTMVGKYSTFRCNDCGAVGHIRTSALSLIDRKKLNTTCAR